MACDGQGRKEKMVYTSFCAQAESPTGRTSAGRDDGEYPNSVLERP